mgnify:CR=1 FL=1
MRSDRERPQSWLSRMKARLSGSLRDLERMHRQRAVEHTVFELRELENVFVLLLTGSFVGLPSPPCAVGFELLPHLKHELRVMHERAENADDMLAELSGILDIE